jgi:hypothetical protein
VKVITALEEASLLLWLGPRTCSDLRISRYSDAGTAVSFNGVLGILEAVDDTEI